MQRWCGEVADSQGFQLSTGSGRDRGNLTAILMLAATLALAGGHQTVAGAVAPDLKAALQIDNTAIGLLATATSVMAAVTTLPFGILADRINRIRLLAGCALAWSVAGVVAGLAQNYPTLLLAQIGLGAGLGVAAPVVASLAGDLFPAARRGRIFGYILAGEFAGAATSLLLAGLVAASWSWRGGFWVLAVPGPVLAVLLLTLLPEPARGAMVQLPPPTGAARGTTGSTLAELASGVEPHRELVLRQDPTDAPMRWAIRYVLSIKTNVLIVIASALVYYYVAGLQTFAVVFLRGRFDLGQRTATVLLVLIGTAVVLGTLITGPLSDRLIAKGWIGARPLVGGLCALVGVAFFAPGFIFTSIAISIPLIYLGAVAFGGVNPPLDAARLDIVHSGLWGRAESVRNFVQTLLKSSAPLVFGYLSTVLSPVPEDPNRVQGGGAVGLTNTFLVMLAILLVGAGLLVMASRYWYPRDVATALASQRATDAR